MLNATAPDIGAGPYNVERSEEDHFYHLTLHGTRTGKSYPLGKTAYRTARKLNDEHQASARTTTIPGFAPAPKPATTGAAGWGPKPVILEPVKPEPVVKVYSGTREAWLNEFAAAARVVFKQHDLELPKKVRISVGFMFRSPKAIGQCWRAEASGDATREIFINPTLDDSSRVADVLTHELCHTLFGPEEKHGKNFKAAVTKLGLVGKATATEAGPDWHAWADPILAKLGPIPHAALDPSLAGIKKQTTRLIKAVCEDCGFTARVTAKWVNAAEDGLQCPDVRCGGVFVCATEEAEG